jgi:putative SOS response-associated peptidase YedK
MCGRYTITVTQEELFMRYLNYTPTDRYHTPRFNVAPSQDIQVIINDGVKNELVEMRWGLVPFWAKDVKIGYKMINARAETVGEKPAYRSLIKNKRCLIPADGFYEWQKNGSKKQPYRFTLNDESIYSFAGLYDTWSNPEGEKLISCTIITTTPNELTKEVHDRMPVILTPENEKVWVDQKNEDKNALLDLLKPYPANQMRKYPVSLDVGNVRNQSEDLIIQLNSK